MEPSDRNRNKRTEAEGGIGAERAQWAIQRGGDWKRKGAFARLLRFPDMSDYEMIVIFLMILAIVVGLLDRRNDR